RMHLFAPPFVAESIWFASAGFAIVLRLSTFGIPYSRLPRALRHGSNPPQAGGAAGRVAAGCHGLPPPAGLVVLRLARVSRPRGGDAVCPRAALRAIGRGSRSAIARRAGANLAGAVAGLRERRRPSSASTDRADDRGLPYG